MRSLGLLVAASLSGCFYVPTHRGLSMERSKVFVAPGSPQVFSATNRMEHRRGYAGGPTFQKEDVNFDVDKYDTDTASRSIISIVDPTTHAEVRLGQLDQEGEPVWFDAKRKILWMADNDGALRAMTTSAPPPANGAKLFEREKLEPPFVLTASDRFTRTLWDLSGNGSINLPSTIDAARISVDGKVVHFTVLEEQDGVVAVSQLSIDWSTGVPTQLPAVVWTSPPLAPGIGTRLAITVVGERYAEVLHDQTGTRLLVFPLVLGSQPLSIALPPAEALGKLATLDADTLVFGEQTDDDKCWRGVTIRIGTATVTPLPESPCITGTATTRGRYVLDTERYAAIVDAKGAVVSLDGIKAAALHDAFATTPTTRTLVVIDDTEHVALSEVNLETGEQHRTPLPGIAAEDRVLGVSDGVATFVRGHDTIVRVALGDKAPTIVRLDDPEMTKTDRMPSFPYELWFGAGGGATTRGTGFGGGKVELARWLDEHWTMIVGATLTGESAKSSTDPKWTEGGPAFGFTWHRLPQLWSVNFGADLGANYAASYVDKKQTDQAFAPSLDVHVGASGSFGGLDIAVLVPSFIDFGRGVQFWATLKFGLTSGGLN
ncbi:MAG TPA: hypothetical protein VGM90_35280 [Kofleriaceae bacterium]|jgi:hypothetical protein